jgi:septum formation protein
MNHYPINKTNPLVLASISPRRKALLEQIGIPFEAVGSMADEALSKGMRPADIACQMAIRKAESVPHVHKNRWILGADTIVVMNRRVFGKPKDSRDCRDMLLRLKGKNHRVITGFCILDPGGKSVHLESVATKVRVKEMSEIEIEAYIKTGEPFGKAGGYAIQGIGSFMIEHIDGSYTNVVGLPVCEVVGALVTCGALRHFPSVE